jgi:hypothetical protein
MNPHAEQIGNRARDERQSPAATEVGGLCARPRIALGFPIFRIFGVSGYEAKATTWKGTLLGM